MSERTLRGARLGAQSFEDEQGVELAPRQRIAYSCPAGHDFEVPMAEEAEVPATWECPRCSTAAHRVDGDVPQPKQDKPVRTHWDMLLERRSIPELEELLAERLELLRGGEIGPMHLHRRPRRSGSERGRKSA